MVSGTEAVATSIGEDSCSQPTTVPPTRSAAKPSDTASVRLAMDPLALLLDIRLGIGLLENTVRVGGFLLHLLRLISG